MDLRKVDVAELEPWPRNPRGITRAALERLKRQIKRLGQYKPMVVKKLLKGYLVLGGNMRLQALRELGVKEAWVSVVEPKTEAEELEYALSDNDRVGRYDRKLLADLVIPARSEVEVEDYQITLGEETEIPALLKEYGPGALVREKEMDEALKTTHECGECGYRW